MTARADRSTSLGMTAEGATLIKRIVSDEVPSFRAIDRRFSYR
jgi:hypothetical protein